VASSGVPNPLYGLTQGPSTQAGCFSYAEGGARVTNPVGPGNAALFTLFGNTSGLLGQLTIPVVTQLAMFHGDGSVNFADTDLVTVLAGGNDLFMNRATVDGTVAQLQAGGLIGTDQGNAIITQAATAAVDAMTQAGTDLANLINNEMLAKGATHVVVVNLPDVSLTPDNALWVANPASGAIVEPLHPHLTLDMTNAFNTALQAGLFTSGDTTSLSTVLWVDAFSQSDAQVSQPATYGLTNMSTPACDLTKTGLTPPGGAPFTNLPSSLFCNADTLIPPTDGTVTDTDPTGVMNFLYADTVHPTPFGYRLLAEYVGLQMSIKGWL
jgi:phospholipase/lecithinase/hemolysin